MLVNSKIVPKNRFKLFSDYKILVYIIKSVGPFVQHSAVSAQLLIEIWQIEEATKCYSVTQFISALVIFLLKNLSTQVNVKHILKLYFEGSSSQNSI